MLKERGCDQWDVQNVKRMNNLLHQPTEMTNTMKHINIILFAAIISLALCSFALPIFAVDTAEVFTATVISEDTADI